MEDVLRNFEQNASRKQCVVKNEKKIEDKPVYKLCWLIFYLYMINFQLFQAKVKKLSIQFVYN